MQHLHSGVEHTLHIYFRRTIANKNDALDEMRFRPPHQRVRSPSSTKRRVTSSHNSTAADASPHPRHANTNVARNSGVPSRVHKHLLLDANEA
jgi:hypothetical protein